MVSSLQLCLTQHAMRLQRGAGELPLAAAGPTYDRWVPGLRHDYGYVSGGTEELSRESAAPAYAPHSLPSPPPLPLLPPNSLPPGPRSAKCADPEPILEDERRRAMEARCEALEEKLRLLEIRAELRAESGEAEMRAALTKQRKGLVAEERRRREVWEEQCARESRNSAARGLAPVLERMQEQKYRSLVIAEERLSVALAEQAADAERRLAAVMAEQQAIAAADLRQQRAALLADLAAARAKGDALAQARVASSEEALKEKHYLRQRAEAAEAAAAAAQRASLGYLARGAAEQRSDHIARAEIVELRISREELCSELCLSREHHGAAEGALAESTTTLLAEQASASRSLAAHRKQALSDLQNTSARWRTEVVAIKAEMLRESAQQLRALEVGGAEEHQIIASGRKADADAAEHRLEVHLGEQSARMAMDLKTQENAGRAEMRLLRIEAAGELRSQRDAVTLDFAERLAASKHELIVSQHASERQQVRAEAEVRSELRAVAEAAALAQRGSDWRAAEGRAAACVAAATAQAAAQAAGGEASEAKAAFSARMLALEEQAHLAGCRAELEIELCAARARDALSKQRQGLLTEERTRRATWEERQEKELRDAAARGLGPVLQDMRRQEEHVCLETEARVEGRLASYEASVDKGAAEREAHTVLQLRRFELRAALEQEDLRETHRRALSRLGVQESQALIDTRAAAAREVAAASAAFAHELCEAQAAAEGATQRGEEARRSQLRTEEAVQTAEEMYAAESRHTKVAVAMATRAATTAAVADSGAAEITKRLDGARAAWQEGRARLQAELDRRASEVDAMAAALQDAGAELSRSGSERDALASALAALRHELAASHAASRAELDDEASEARAWQRRGEAQARWARWALQRGAETAEAGDA